MPELLLIDVALCAALIMVAALIVWGHRRRGRNRPPARTVERHEPAAYPAARPPMAARETAVVPGLSAAGARTDLGAQAPAGPEPAPEPRVIAEPAPEPSAGPEPAPVPTPGPEPAPEPSPGPEPAAQPQAGAVIGLEPAANGQGPSPNGRPAAAEPDTTSDPIGSYYDEADRPMSDYLASLGWTGEPVTRHPQAADAEAAPGGHGA